MHLIDASSYPTRCAERILRRKAMICWRRTTFSARRAAREWKAERSAPSTVLRISMSIVAQRLPKADHWRNRGGNSTLVRPGTGFRGGQGLCVAESLFGVDC